MKNEGKISNLRIYLYLCKNTILSIFLSGIILFFIQIITEIQINNMDDLWNISQAVGFLLLGLLVGIFPLLCLIALLPALFVIRKLVTNGNFKMRTWVAYAVSMIVSLNILFFVAVGIELAFNTGSNSYDVGFLGDPVIWVMVFVFFYFSSIVTAYLTRKDVVRHLNT